MLKPVSVAPKTTRSGYDKRVEVSKLMLSRMAGKARRHPLNFVNDVMQRQIEKLGKRSGNAIFDRTRLEATASTEDVVRAVAQTTGM